MFHVMYWGTKNNYLWDGISEFLCCRFYHTVNSVKSFYAVSWYDSSNTLYMQFIFYSGYGMGSACGPAPYTLKPKSRT